MNRSKIFTSIGSLGKAVKKILFIFGIFIFSLLIGKGVYFIRDGFTPRRVQNHMSNLSSSQIAPEALKILSQDYYYLGRGRQCFAFASKDGKYVLKCPRMDIYHLPFWVRVIGTSSYKKKHLEQKLDRSTFTFNSMRLANEKLKKVTGVLYNHLETTAPIEGKITLHDSLGQKHTLPIHTTLFVLQTKQAPWTPAFLNAKTLQEKERLLSALIDNIVERAKTGILNRDRSFLRNYGTDGEKVYQVDLGSFYESRALTTGAAYYKSAQDSLDAIREWLSATDPECLPLIDQRVSTL